MPEFFLYPLDKAAAIGYAKKWAMLRNPMYYDFENAGGDCTSFISQCVRAGGAVMNYTKDVGWYYNSPYDRSAPWSSVYYFHKFITTNAGVGPYGEEAPIDNAAPGDIIQLGDGEKFYHSLFVTGLRRGVPLVCAHTDNALDRSLNSYRYETARCIKILGVRKR